MPIKRICLYWKRSDQIASIALASFSVASIIDGSEELEDPGMPVVPVLGFATTEARDEPVACDEAHRLGHKDIQSSMDWGTL
jgi:hypothetical protein